MRKMSALLCSTNLTPSLPANRTCTYSCLYATSRLIVPPHLYISSICWDGHYRPLAARLVCGSSAGCVLVQKSRLCEKAATSRTIWAVQEQLFGPSLTFIVHWSCGITQWFVLHGDGVKPEGNFISDPLPSYYMQASFLGPLALHQPTWLTHCHQ
ncbi:uncharacterized protein YALI1_E00695g [Yarrowia lipolytica]|uniref:Uncharacterized protein n=1 Tax=Yarrowia lipolytica TaxID=4952 RepID=A0A1D8NGK2_YARLL|nr:hypothetical protein YALI1_E00695g [Yarrowia lipolytica]